MGVLIVLLTVISFVSFSKDPFVNREDAVGYIIVDEGGKTFKYIVLESKDGKVKLMKTKYEPAKVLKKGGKTK